jgi:hypothetical protein
MPEFQPSQVDEEILIIIDEIAQLETCDLCDDPAEYRQCQKCMNDKLIGSHTDEEYKALEVRVIAAEKEANRRRKEFEISVGRIIHLEAQRDSWRRVASRLEEEKQVLQGGE